MYTAQQRENYNLYRNVICERLGINKAQYNAFRKIGQALHKLYEADYNGELTEEEYERMTNAWYEKAINEAKILELEIFFQTDPRGATIYLSKDPIADNNYNRFGSECVY